MTTTRAGCVFPGHWQWGVEERVLLDNLQGQIDQAFPDDNNLFINTVWFGPQFEQFGEWERVQEMIENGFQVDNLFLLAAADPVFLNRNQIDDFVKFVNPKKKCYMIGNFDNEYDFNWQIAELIPKYMKPYTEEELVLQDPKWLYLCYNRKPRVHRVQFVKKLRELDLLKYGIVSLGKNDKTYNTTDEDDFHILLGEKPEDYAQDGNWGNDMSFGIPHDIHSLGNMDYWQNHFLTIVSETEFLPWDNTFLTEKAWKPVWGLRPMVLNGQPKIYKWLRHRGFKTFNHYLGTKKQVFDLETASDIQIHDTLIAVIKNLQTKSKEEIKAMYEDMLPDLRYNKERLFEFGREQQHKINHLFECHNITY